MIIFMLKMLCVWSIVYVVFMFLCVISGEQRCGLLRADDFTDTPLTARCRSLWILLYTCRTDCSPCWMPPLGSSTGVGRQNTQLHCYGSFTGYASRNESSSGCVLWRIPSCAWHSTGVPVWQPAADIRDRRSSLSPLCRHHDPTSAVDSSGYPPRPRLSGGCSAGMEQSATRDSSLLLTFDIPERDQSHLFRQSYGWLGTVYSDRQLTSALSCERFWI